MRVRNAAGLALAETLVACHSGTSVDTAVHAPRAPKAAQVCGADGFCWQIDRLEVAWVKWRISGAGKVFSCRCRPQHDQRETGLAGKVPRPSDDEVFRFRIQ